MKVYAAYCKDDLIRLKSSSGGLFYGDEYVKYNPSIVNSARKHIFSDYFYNELGKRRFDKLVNDCLHPNYYSRIARKILELNQK